MTSAGMPTVRLDDQAGGWEYRVARVNIAGLFSPNVDENQISEYLNDAGSQDWELVSTVDINRGNGASVELLLIMKRPRRS